MGRGESSGRGADAVLHHRGGAEEFSGSSGASAVAGRRCALVCTQMRLEPAQRPPERRVEIKRHVPVRIWTNTQAERRGVEVVARGGVGVVVELLLEEEVVPPADDERRGGSPLAT